MDDPDYYDAEHDVYPHCRACASEAFCTGGQDDRCSRHLRPRHVFRREVAA